MKKKLVLSFSLLLFAGLLWYNLQQTVDQDASASDGITMVEVQQMAALADEKTGDGGGSGCYTNEQWSYSYMYCPIQGLTIQCISTAKSCGAGYWGYCFNGILTTCFDCDSNFDSWGGYDYVDCTTGT